MSRLRSILGYLGALLAFPIILATFVGNDFWAKELVTSTGLKVSPRLTGGEVTQVINAQEHQTLIHRAVFDGLIRQRKQGFVQINWQPTASVLPEEIDEEIDYNDDGKLDFRIQLNTVNNNAVLTPYRQSVVALENYYNLGNEKAIRVVLKNDSGGK